MNVALIFAGGRGQRMNTKTPIPPIQWVKLLHSNIQWERASTSERILAPVVVNPDTVSNIASIGLGILPDITNGNAPAILKTIQLRATVTAPSFA